MGTWSKERTEQHRVRYPPEQARERNRLAQARYRQRHAKRRAHVRVIANILTRQSWHAKDIEHLAKALRACLTKAGAADLAARIRR